MDAEDKAIHLRTRIDYFEKRIERLEEEQRSLVKDRDALQQELAELECPFQVGDCYQREEEYWGGDQWHPVKKTRTARVFISSIQWNKWASWSWEAKATSIKKDGTPHASRVRYFGTGEEWTKLPGRMIDGRYQETEEKVEENA